MISAVVLAAGLSSRMGRPKQLLKLGDKTILEHVVGHVQKARVDEVIVVLGAFREEIEQLLSSFQIKCVANLDYRCGIATTVAKGASEAAPEARGILFVNGDQPLITAGYINRLIEIFYQRRALIIRCKTGTPALFNACLREELTRLSGDTGGRQLFDKYRDRSVIIPEPSGLAAVDVDTEEQYDQIRGYWNTVILPPDKTD